MTSALGDIYASLSASEILMLQAAFDPLPVRLTPRQAEEMQQLMEGQKQRREARASRERESWAGIEEER